MATTAQSVNSYFLSNHQHNLSDYATQTIIEYFADLNQLHGEACLYAVLSPRAKVEMPVRHQFSHNKDLVEPFSNRAAHTMLLE